MRNGVLLHNSVNLVFYSKFLFLKRYLFQLFVVVWICKMCKFAQSLFEVLMLMYQLSEGLIALYQFIPHRISD